MALSRRQFLIGAGLAAAATTAGLAGCAPGSGGSQSGSSGSAANITLAFWGNPTRNKNTQAEIDAFVKANPNMKITGQPGDFASYWDKLATQTAGGTAPDIIQMDMAYIAEYGNRGALLDLAKSAWTRPSSSRAPSTRARSTASWSGSTPASTAWFSSPTRSVFEKAKVAVPDDKTWTWDDMMDVAAEVAEQGRGNLRAGVRSSAPTSRSARGSASTARNCSSTRASASTRPTPRAGTT